MTAHLHIVTQLTLHLNRLAGVALLLIGLGTPGWAQTSAPKSTLQPGSIHFQFAIYYPSEPKRPPVAALKEQLKMRRGAPVLIDAIPDQPVAIPSLTAKLMANAQTDYRPPDLEMVQRFGRGLTRQQAEALQQAQQALVLDFVHPTVNSIAALRVALLITAEVARETNGLLWDEETREVFSPDEWQRRRLEAWQDNIPDVSRHTVIHAYASDKLVRAITLGMAKFGMPDVVVNDFPWSSNRPVGHLINLLAQALVEGAAIRTPGAYRLDARTIQHNDVRQTMLRSVKGRGTARADLMLVTGAWEEGDPRNRLVEIRFDRSPGADRYARQEALLDTLFGFEDSVQQVQHTSELLAASQAANAKLPALRDAFARGLQPGEYILVKVPFTTPDGGNEWMWVEVMNWQGDVITGLLKNEPANIPGLHAGQQVKVSQRQVFDYLRRDANGRETGNETGKVLQRMQSTGR